MLDKLKDYLKYRLWAAQQYPDPAYLYAKGGIAEVVRYLKGCASGTRTREILAQFGAQIHPEAHPIGPWITIHEAGLRGDFGNLEVGRSCYIGPAVFLDLSEKIIVEESVGIAMRAIILTHMNLGDGYPNKPIADVLKKFERPTILRRGCCIGAGSIVLPGITVGEDSVVGAGVVVKENVPPRTIVQSSPHHPDYTIPDRWFPEESALPADE